MAVECISEIPGAVELVNWFGGFPSFHDAKAALQINGDGTGHLKADGFRMSNEVDEKGFFILERQFSATFLFAGLRSVAFTDFLPGNAIISQLTIRKLGEVFEVDLRDTSYGFSGILTCESIRIEYEPKP